MKKLVSITLDFDVWFFYTSKQNNNLSGMINQFLKYQMEEEKTNKDELELENELEIIKSKKKELEQQMYKMQSALINIKAKKEEDYKEEMERVEVMQKTIRNSNLVRDLI